jgi:hypothetical protein
MKKAKVKNETANVDFDLDSELDLGDFDFGGPLVKDDRVPSTKFKDGFIEGVKSGATKTSFLKSTIKDILPAGYGKTLDMSEKVADSARSLYDESAREIKPAIKDFKRLAAKLVPKESSLVPKSVKEMIKRWEAEKDEYEAINKNSQRESMLTSQMGEAFKEQFIQAAKDRGETEAKDRLQQGIELTRHRDTFGILNQSNQHLSSLSQYQLNITLPYQKKSLELKYRQLFALQDIVEESRKANALHTSAYANLIKNTALPDFVKINDKEFRAQVFKNKFYEGIQRGLFGGRDDYIEKISSNLKSMALGKVKEGVGAFRMGAMGVEMGVDGSEQGQEMGGPGKTEMAGSLVGGGASQGLIYAAGRQLKKRVLDKNSALHETGKKLEQGVDDLPRTINEFRKSSKYDMQDGIKGGAMRFLQSLIPGFGPDTSMEKIGLKGMESPYVITRRTDKSFNEVIPGYLARILREVQVFRTGNEKIELTEYDLGSGKFVSKTKSIVSTFRRLVSKDTVKRTQGQLDSIIKDLDPEDKLSKEEKEALKRRLLKNSTLQNKASKDNLTKYSAFDPKHADKLHAHMSEYFANATQDQKNLLSTKHNELTNYFADPRADMQLLMNVGKSSDLKQLGLLDKSGMSMDMDSLLNYHLGARPNISSQGKPGGDFIDDTPGPKDPMGPRPTIITDKAKQKLANIKRRMKSMPGRAIDKAVNTYSTTTKQDVVDAAKNSINVAKSLPTG